MNKKILLGFLLIPRIIGASEQAPLLPINDSILKAAAEVKAMQQRRRTQSDCCGYVQQVFGDYHPEVAGFRQFGDPAAFQHMTREQRIAIRTRMIAAGVSLTAFLVIGTVVAARYLFGSNS